MIKTAVFFLAALLSLFFLMGCYGIQKPQECDGLINPTAKMDCYYRVATGYAYAADKTGVMVYCDLIDQLGQTYGRKLSNKDFERTAELTKNRCYYDSAVIIAQKDTVAAKYLCEQISQRTDPLGFNTASITQDACLEKVEKLAAASLSNYYSNPSNICSLLFILIGFLAVLFFHHSIHKF